jgi:hypothetical protein
MRSGRHALDRLRSFIDDYVRSQGVVATTWKRWALGIQDGKPATNYDNTNWPKQPGQRNSPCQNRLNSGCVSIYR